MSTKSSKKRAGEEPNEVPPKKMVPEVMEAPDSVNNDITIITNGQRFQCLKEELSHHSMYFQKMFNSSFQEKDEKEVELGGIVESSTFDMFLKVVHGEGVVTDATVVELLGLADYLESNTLEANCIHHLGQKTCFSLEEQFQMAETYHSQKLMSQVCASIKEAYELDKVVPKDLDSFCNTTKNLVMQRSFELLGIRRPLSTPLPEDQDQKFEQMMSQMVDQIEIQSHQGEVLLNQAILLSTHIGAEHFLCQVDKPAREIVRRDPLIKELTDQLRETHVQKERNFIQAQIQVMKFKHIYTRVQNQEIWLDPSLKAHTITSIHEKLRSLASATNYNERSRSQSQKVTLGNREIDKIYRGFITEVMEENPEEQPANMNESAVWLEDINALNRTLANIQSNAHGRIQRPMPDGLRHVSNKAGYQAINELVSNLRYTYYLAPRGNNQEHNVEMNEDGPNQDLNDQNPQEQDQDGN